MKRKFIYVIAFLVILGAVIGPALYMQKVFSSDQQNKQVESNGANSGVSAGAADKEQPAAETKQVVTATAQQAAVPDSALREDAATARIPGDASALAQQAAAPDSTSRGDAATARIPGDTAALPPESGCMVGIAIVGKNGETLYNAGQVLVKKDNKWGITALGTLDASGVSYTTSPTWPDFVYSISGQANSGVSGWMYSVNGDVPMHMADKHPVKEGDRVIWWYSNSMEQPQPLWDDLTK